MSRTDIAKHTRAALWAAFALTAAFAAPARAGFRALPLEAEVDLAENVVVGKLVRIEPARLEYEGRMAFSRGAIAVRETLKGVPSTEVPVNVVSAMDHGLANQMQSPPRTYAVGTDGIWIVVDGAPSHGYGVLPESRRDEVRAIVKRLGSRTWSEEVSGLKCWAGSVGVEAAMRRGDNGPRGVIFAVKNVSDRTLHLPRSLYGNVMTAVATDAAGRTHTLGMAERVTVTTNAAGRTIVLREPVQRQTGGSTRVCLPLASGKTRYMHPDGEDYGYIRIPNGLAPGRYVVTATFRNDADGEQDGMTGRKVNAWKGELAAPPVALVIPPDGAAARFLPIAPKDPKTMPPPDARYTGQGLHGDF